jgi:hypothetical protein
MQFEVINSCSSSHPPFTYFGGQIITLGVEITDETATDLLRAGHIKKYEAVAECTAEPAEPVAAPTVERATVAPAETAMKTPTVRKPSKSTVAKDA